ncbi:11467_t:CDS:2, partial [Ambispora gerdemannii]
KERVSNEIRDRNREKKLQHESAGNQAQDLSHVILTESPSLQTEVSELEQDDEIDKNQIVEQGLIQELHLPTKENNSSIKIGNSGSKSGNMFPLEILPNICLIYLKHQSIKATGKLKL